MAFYLFFSLLSEKSSSVFSGFENMSKTNEHRDINVGGGNWDWKPNWNFCGCSSQESKNKKKMTDIDRFALK